MFVLSCLVQVTKRSWLRASEPSSPVSFQLVFHRSLLLWRWPKGPGATSPRLAAEVKPCQFSRLLSDDIIVALRLFSSVTWLLCLRTNQTSQPASNPTKWLVETYRESDERQPAGRQGDTADPPPGLHQCVLHRGATAHTHLSVCVCVCGCVTSQPVTLNTEVGEDRWPSQRDLVEAHNVSSRPPICTSVLSC